MKEKRFLSKLSYIFGGDGVLTTINRSSDLILAAWVIGVVVMIILPVPPAVIDLCITFNLTQIYK